MKLIFASLFVLSGFYCCAQSNKPEKMTSLFNGKDLSGWYSYFNSKGKNNDVEKIFTVEDGLLHITGKEFGYIGSEKSYKDFHLVAEFKWGAKKWPPRDGDTVRRDNGILFNIPIDYKDRVWPKSVECQVQEGDVGDIYLIAGATVVVDGVKKDGPFLRIKKKADGEFANGKWNKVEVISNQGNITYIVNGKVVNQASSPNITEGKIAIQSEGAEIFYRKIAIAEL